MSAGTLSTEQIHALIAEVHGRRGTVIRVFLDTGVLIAAFRGKAV
jgi:hypothetical protein